ncbi:MAG: GHKL domain-containing protein [Pleomorphochaeta sp.]
MVVSNEISHLLVVEPLYLIQLITCWNLLPQKNNRKKNLLFLLSAFSILLAIYNYLLFFKGFDAAFNSVFILLTIPGFVLYFIISKYKDGRLVFSYFFSDSMLSIFNFLTYVIGIHFFKELTVPFIIVRDVSMIIFALLFNLLYIPKIRKALNTKDVNWNIIALIAAFAGVYIYFELTGEGSMLNRQNELFPITLTFLLLCIVFLTLLWTLVKIREKEQQNIELLKKENALDLVRTQLKQVDSTYQQINQTYDKVRMIRHDINKEISIIQALCDEGDIDKVKEYTLKLTKKIPIQNFIKYSNNHMLNSILNHYKSILEKENIPNKFTIIYNILDETITSDICIIISNAIDNAIEATIKAENRFIDINIRQEENSILISVKNSYNEQYLKKSNNKLISTKKDAQNHGLGLKIIEHIISSFYGNMLYTTDDSIFRLDIWLYL